MKRRLSRLRQRFRAFWRSRGGILGAKLLGVYDQVSCGSAGDSLSMRLEVLWRLVPVFALAARHPKEPRGAVLTSFGKILLEQAIHARNLRAGRRSGYGWSSDDNVIPSFSYFHAVTDDMNGRGHWTVRQLPARHWALVAAFRPHSGSVGFCIASARPCGNAPGTAQGPRI